MKFIVPFLLNLLECEVVVVLTSHIMYLLKKKIEYPLKIDVTLIFHKTIYA